MDTICNMKYTLCKLWLTSMLLAGCGSGPSSRAQIDDSRRPPPLPAPPAAVAPTPGDPRSDSAPASDSEEATRHAAATTRHPPLRVRPGTRAAVLIGARVEDVRSDPAEIVVQVGDSVALGEDLLLVAYDARDQPVRGVVVRPALESRFAVLEGGYLRGASGGYGRAAHGDPGTAREWYRATRGAEILRPGRGRGSGRSPESRSRIRVGSWSAPWSGSRRGRTPPPVTSAPPSRCRVAEQPAGSGHCGRAGFRTGVALRCRRGVRHRRRRRGKVRPWRSTRARSQRSR